ncbi:MAG TPA: response regulator transcription factor [Methylophilaceae bacterium]|nr:response regulator transcription factor [Methylophilaceae bacterium]
MDINTPSAPVALIIEDDPSIGMLLEFLLQREGFAPKLLTEGRSAQLAIQSDAAPALILLDIMLPYVDGVELLQQIRKQTGWERTAVIMLTTKSNEHDIVRALELGANDYVVKPFQPNELLARIRRHVKRAN